MRFPVFLAVVVLCVANSALAQAPVAVIDTPSTQSLSTQSQAATLEKAAAPAAAPEKVDPAKDAAIRHLLDVTDESKWAGKMNEFLIGRVREAVSRTLPPDRLQKFMETFTQKILPGRSRCALKGVCASRG